MRLADDPVSAAIEHSLILRDVRVSVTICGLLVAGLLLIGLRSPRIVAALVASLAGLFGIVALVPLVGPLIVKILSIGFIWLLNAIGYLVSYIAIKRGYSKDVLTYRGLTIAVIIGILIGYVLGKLI